VPLPGPWACIGPEGAETAPLRLVPLARDCVARVFPPLAKGDEGGFDCGKGFPALTVAGRFRRQRPCMPCPRARRGDPPGRPGPAGRADTSVCPYPSRFRVAWSICSKLGRSGCSDLPGVWRWPAGRAPTSRPAPHRRGDPPGRPGPAGRADTSVCPYRLGSSPPHRLSRNAGDRSAATFRRLTPDGSGR